MCCPFAFFSLGFRSFAPKLIERVQNRQISSHDHQDQNEDQSARGRGKERDPWRPALPFADPNPNAIKPGGDTNVVRTFGAKPRHSRVYAGNDRPARWTLPDMRRKPQTNQQANAKKAKIIPCAILFIILFLI